MKTFEEVKKLIIDLAKKGQACESEFKKAIAAENYDQLLPVIVDNSIWCFNAGIFSEEILSNIQLEKLNEYGIFWNQKNIEAQGDSEIIACGSATVKACGSATVKACDSATVKAWGSATVKAWGSATVIAWGSATVIAWGSATVIAWGSATVKACGSATVKACDSAYINIYDVNNVTSFIDNAVIRERSTGIIHINTNVQIKVHEIKEQ